MGWKDTVLRRPTQMDKNVLDLARKHIRSHRAAQVAATLTEQRISIAEQKSKFSIDTENLYQQRNEFLNCSLEAELALRQELKKMKNEEKVSTLFELFDIDKNYFLNAQELVQCLLKIDRRKTFKEALQAAELSIEAFDSDENGRLDRDEFQVFLSRIAKQVNCEAQDLSRYLILRVLSSDNGATVVGETIMNGNLEGWNGPFNDKFVQARVVILFQLLDFNEAGVVEFKEVVKSMYKVAQDMDEKFRRILFVVDKKDKNGRTLTLTQFAEFVFNVVAASPAHVGLHEVANAMTLALCSYRCACNIVDYSDLFDKYGLHDTSENIQGSTQVSVNPLEYGRMDRLFDLWDLDHSGYIEFSEFFLGLRKFHETKDPDTTFLETVTAMSRFDVNEKDEKLDRIEFCVALSQFAEASSVDLSTLIDYMVVQSALKDNKQAERDYAKTMKTHADIQENLGALWPWGRRQKVAPNSEAAIKEANELPKSLVC